MVKRGNLERSPKDYLEDPHDWPYGRMKIDDEPVLYLIRDICVELRRAFEGKDDKGEEWSFRKIAKECEVSPKSIYDLWHGISWGTLPVIASIEIYLNKRIWGREHLSQARKQEPN